MAGDHIINYSLENNNNNAIKLSIEYIEFKLKDEYYKDNLPLNISRNHINNLDWNKIFNKFNAKFKNISEEFIILDYNWNNFDSYSSYNNEWLKRRNDIPLLYAVQQMLIYQNDKIKDFENAENNKQIIIIAIIIIITGLTILISILP